MVLNKTTSITTAFIFIFLLFLQGCASGFTVMQTGEGNVITYEKLRSFDSGSLSTVWYQGSDESYHHFVHFIKTQTKYRVKKDQLKIDEEFPLGSKKSIHIMELKKEQEALKKAMSSI